MTLRVEDVERALAAPDPEERRQAASRLGELTIEQVVKPLLQALSDESWRVRKEATVVAQTFASHPRLVAALLPVLAASDDVGLRNAVVDVLASSGAAATPGVTALMADLDADGRKLAVEILGRGGDLGALDALAVALGDDEDNVRQAATEAISALGRQASEAARSGDLTSQSRASALLLRALEDADGMVRMTALDGLTSTRTQLPWDRLKPLLAEPALRNAALRAAALSEEPEAVRALVDQIPHVRAGMLVEVLGALSAHADGPRADEVRAGLRVADEATRRQLHEALTSAQAAMRAPALVLAAMAGSRLAAWEAARALAEPLPEPALSRAAQKALELLGADALGPIVEALRADEGAGFDPEVYASLINTACALPSEPGTAPRRALHDVLIAAAAQPSDAVAYAALRGLASLGSGDDLPVVAGSLDDERPAVAAAAERATVALARSFPEQAAKLLGDPSERQAASLRTVLLRGALATDPIAPASLAFFAQAAAVGEPRTRRAAITTMAEHPSKASVDVLVLALTDEEPTVRLAAARALGRFAEATASPPVLEPVEVLSHIARSGDPSLVAATVRILGDGLAAQPASAQEPLALALAGLACASEVPLALAAVDALSRLPQGSRVRRSSLRQTLNHGAVAVVRAALRGLGVEVEPGAAEPTVLALAHAELAEGVT